MLLLISWLYCLKMLELLVLTYNVMISIIFNMIIHHRHYDPIVYDVLLITMPLLPCSRLCEFQEMLWYIYSQVHSLFPEHVYQIKMLSVRQCMYACIPHVKIADTLPFLYVLSSSIFFLFYRDYNQNVVYNEIISFFVCIIFAFAVHIYFIYKQGFIENKKLKEVFAARQQI